MSLMRKAGWKGRSAEWRDVKGLEIVRYEGKKASLGWAEWRAWRSWVEGFEELETSRLARYGRLE